MTSKTHALTGGGIAALVASAASLPMVPVVAGALIGSLLPDIDHPNAKINRKILIFKNKMTLQITFILLGLMAFLYTQNHVFKLIGVFLILTALSAHRQFTHSMAGTSLFSTICLYCIYTFPGLNFYAMGLILGYVVHLLTDSLSNQGISIFYPFSQKKFGLGLITTGGITEIIFSVLSILAMVYVSRIV